MEDGRRGGLPLVYRLGDNGGRCTGRDRSPPLPLVSRASRGARIAEFVGQRDLTVTANTYTHVLTDETGLDYANLPV